MDNMDLDLIIKTFENSIGGKVRSIQKFDNVPNNICPICGNVIMSIGEAVVSCHGIILPVQESEAPDSEHAAEIQRVEDEYYVKIDHEMSKSHYISFIAVLKDDGFEIKKLYPEGDADARFDTNRTRYVYYYCNHHGLFAVKVR